MRRYREIRHRAGLAFARGNYARAEELEDEAVAMLGRRNLERLGKRGRTDDSRYRSNGRTAPWQ